MVERRGTFYRIILITVVPSSCSLYICSSGLTDGVNDVNSQYHRDGALLFEGTVISQKLSPKQFSIFLCRHLFVCHIN